MSRPLFSTNEPLVVNCASLTRVMVVGLFRATPAPCGAKTSVHTIDLPCHPGDVETS